MWRIRKLCIYLDEFIKIRPLGRLTPDYEKIHRNGITEDKLKEFSQFMSEKEGKQVKIEKDEVSDLIKREFFEEYAHPLYDKIALIRVGWKGRQLIKGNWIVRWKNFANFVYVQNPVVWVSIGILIGVLGSPFVQTLAKTSWNFFSPQNHL